MREAHWTKLSLSGGLSLALILVLLLLGIGVSTGVIKWITLALLLFQPLLWVLWWNSPMLSKLGESIPAGKRNNKLIAGFLALIGAFSLYFIFDIVGSARLIVVYSQLFGAALLFYEYYKMKKATE